MAPKNCTKMFQCLCLMNDILLVHYGPSLTLRAVTDQATGHRLNSLIVQCDHSDWL